MRNFSTRAGKAVAAAAFGAAFIGSALAASPTDGIGGLGNNNNGGDSSATGTSSMPSTSGLSNNGLTSVDMPKVSGSGVSYITKHHGNDFDVPGGGGVQAPVKQKHNSVADKGKADVAGIKL